MIIKLTNEDDDVSIARKIIEADEKGEKIDYFEVDIKWLNVPIKYKEK